MGWELFGIYEEAGFLVFQYKVLGVSEVTSEARNLGGAIV